MAIPGTYEWYLLEGGGGPPGGPFATGLPKIEGEVYVPPAGWDLGIEDSGGSDSFSIPGGRYYLTSLNGVLLSLTDTISALLNGSSILAGAGDFTLVVDDDYDTSSGRVTIASSEAFDINFTTPALRDALGHQGSASGLDEYVGAFSSPHIWLPDGKRWPAMSPDGWRGMRIAASTVGRSPGGRTSARKGPESAVDRLEFGQVRAFKCWQRFEVVPNESWETYWSVNLPRRVRYHKDRAGDDTFVTYRILGQGVTEMGLRVEAETAMWTSDDLSLWHLGPVEVINQDASSS
jgi:hypothetical protein